MAVWVLLGLYISTRALLRNIVADYNPECWQYLGGRTVWVVFLNCVSCTGRQERTFFCVLVVVNIEPG